MFQSYECIQYLGYNEKIKQHEYEYKIIDTDFEDIIVCSAPETPIEVVIIDYYTKRGLPVAPNLFRYMLHRRDKYGVSFDEQVEWHKERNPRWHEVADDMKIYLLLS